MFKLGSPYNSTLRVGTQCLCLFYHNLTLDSEPCTKENEMLDVFNFTTCTELVLYDDFTEKGVMQAATIFPNSSMEYMFVSASSEIINRNSCRVDIFFLKEETEVQD